MKRHAVLAVTSRILSFVALLAIGGTNPATAQALQEFAGIPSVKISEGGSERLPEAIDRLRAANLHCIISKIGDEFYWASRENKPLVRLESGTFVTYLAVDGSGYVRVILPQFKKAAAMMGDTEARCEYVEHLLIGLRSVTYYGS